MRIICLFLLLAILFSINISCEYEPHGENFITLERPDTTRTIALLELSPFQTSYIITVPTYVQYNLNTFGLTTHNVEFFIGDVSIHKSATPTGGFTFFPSPWGIGIQTMSMVVNTNSNTGSLADLLKAEELIFKLQWELLLDGGNPNPVEITNIFNDDGILKIEWEKYERINFQKYILYKNFGDAEAPYSFRQVATIEDPSVTSWHDGSFVGGTGIYWIEVYGSNLKATSVRKQFDHDYPQIDTLWQRNDSAMFVWSKNQFPKALRKTYISLIERLTFHPQNMYISENPNDTSYLATGLKFGSQMTYVLGFSPIEDIPVYADVQILKSYISFAIGNDFPNYERIASSDEGNILYVQNRNSVSKMTFPEKKILSTHDYDLFRQWFISPDGKTMVSTKFDVLYKHNHENIGLTKSFDMYNLGMFNIFRGMSNEGLMMADLFQGVGMYDIINERFVWNVKVNNMEYSSISPDGKYSLRKSYVPSSPSPRLQMIELTSSGPGEVKEILEMNVVNNFWVPTENHTFVLISENRITGYTSDKSLKIFDAQTLELENEFHLQSQNLLHLSILKNILVTSEYYPNTDDYKHLNIYRLTTGELIHRMNLAKRFECLTFHGTTVFSGEGYYFDITKL